MKYIRQWNLFKIFSITLLILVLITRSLTNVSAQDDDQDTDLSQSTSSETEILEPSYSEIFPQWQEEYQVGPADFSESFPLNQQTEDSTANLVEEGEAFEYGDSVVHMIEDASTTVEVTVPETGLYLLGYDYYRLNEGLIEPEFSFQINDQHPYYESRRVIAKSLWQNENDEFPLNQYGNQMIPVQVPIDQWNQSLVYDPNYEQANALVVQLNEGSNLITLMHQSGEFLLGSLYVTTPQELKDYATYINEMEDVSVSEGEELITIEAETPTYKSDSYIRPIAQKNISVVPYDPVYNLLNTFGGDSWQRGGQSVTWELPVEEAGFYHISLKTLQNNKQKTPVFRNLKINGEIPFAEVQHYRVNPSDEWVNQTLSDSEGEAFAFYLEEGINELTLEVDISPFTSIVDNLSQLMTEINQLGIALNQLTGNRTDANRDWNIIEYMPNLIEQFDGWIAILEEDLALLQETYGQNETSPPDEVTMQILIDRLESLKSDPNDLPNRLGELSQGTSSVTQSMGNLIVELQKSPLLLDRLYVHQANADLPQANTGMMDTFTSKIEEFYYSFQRPSIDMTTVEEDTLQVWVGRSQQYVEIMQAMVDRDFTAETGIEVKLSLMPNESKIILANAADQQPDVALGVSVGQPFELAIRGASVNLSEFEDFDEIAQRFSPGAFLPLMLDDNAYGLPETQDFYVLFYREDILNQLEIPIPNTWQDVLNILPELQRAGMNFYIPLSSTAGMKPFMFTAPFIYQFGGEIYAEDGFSTAIDSENSLAGIDFMTDLYTLYSIPLQVPNFYNSFRYGEIPIGISNFQTYVQLSSAAPEIRNSWKLAPYPGIPEDDGSINRESPGSAQTAMIFNKSDKQEEGWEFLKWWTSAEVQMAFASEIQTAYGPEFMWHTANLEAFEQLPWPEDDKIVILEQWEQLREVPKIPGSYMIERELSNVWTDIVFYGANTRATVDDSVIYANREVEKKMNEFGYLDGNEVIKPYKIPRLETVESWVE